MNRFFALVVLLFTGVMCVPAGADDDHSDHDNHMRVVNCANGDTITRALSRVHPGDTLFVSGTCSENVVISSPTHQFDGLTIDGQGSAVISGSDSTLNTLDVTGVSGLTLKGITVTGGNDGIALNTASQTAIDNVIVQLTGRHGIHFQRASTGFVTNSTIAHNSQNGVIVNENSYVRIGFTAEVGASQGATGPCIISNNGGHGVRVQRNSAARVYVSTIDGNVNDGVHVESDSYAEVASNEIGGNKNGVFVSENSVLHLGNPTGTKNEDVPNSSTVPNTAFGLTASWGAYVQGRLDGMTGVSGASSFTHGAVSNLTP